jgi:hypothetical protein
MSQKVQQLDTPLTATFYGILPKALPGRVRADDFIFFNYPPNMHSGDYDVAISSLDTSNVPIKTIGPLQKNVELPFVKLDAYAMVYVMPRLNPHLPTFKARLNRGSTYDITFPNVHKPGQQHQMLRHGVLTSAV